MRDRIWLPLLIFPILVFSIEVMARTPQSTQANSDSALHRSKWTETDERVLLASAKGGDAKAQCWLGAGYEQGWFGKTDFHAALNWLRKSAKDSNPDAENSLGQMYEDGEGVKRNYKEAAKWYCKAAEHIPDFGGAGQGRNNLGLLYMKGLGVPRDYLQAYMWFSLGNAAENVSCAKTQLTPSEIIDAERMATDWKRRHSIP
jgi:uncharacterized protein